MKFELNTHEIQLMVISLINSRYTHENTVTTQYPEDMDKLIRLFGDINGKCKSDNDYTLKFTIE